MSTATSMTPLEELMATPQETVDPSLHPSEVFELFSIPAYDFKAPEVVEGSAIGSAKKCVEPGDVLLSRIVPHIRRAWVVPEASGHRQIASGEWIVFRSKKFNASYLQHLLVSDVFHTQFMNTVAGVGGSLLRARPAFVAKIEIPLQPLPEQKRIADILDKADAIRRKRREAASMADDVTPALFREMFGDPVSNEKDWPLRPFGELAANQDGRRKPVKASDRAQVQGEYPYYGASGIIDYVDSYLFDETSLLIAEDGANLLARSTPVAFIASGKYWVNNHAHVVTENGAARLRYLSTHLNLRSIRDFVTGSAQPKLNQANLNKIPIPYPPLSLQDEFDRRLDAVALIRAKQTDADTDADAVFNSLVQKAFSGGLS